MNTILFDLDDTLLDFGKAEEIALPKTFAAFGIEPSEDILQDYAVINDGLWRALEKGEVSRNEILTERFRRLAELHDFTYDAQNVQDTYFSFLSQGHYFMEYALETIQALSDQYNLYIASNGSKVVQDGRLKSADILKYFKGAFISEDIGAEKPTKEFFDYCFEKIEDFSPEKTVIVGDGLTSDILGGNRAGIQTVWYNPKHKENNTSAHVDYEIDHLSRLEDVLKEVFA